MKRNIAVAFCFVLGASEYAAPAAAQGPTLRTRPASQIGQIELFRSGLEITLDNGGYWIKTTKDAYLYPCPDSATSPCGSGASDYITYRIRFPEIAGAVDLSEWDAQHGRNTPAQRMHYEVLLVKGSTQGMLGKPLCLTEFRIDGSSPGDTEPVFLYPTREYLKAPTTPNKEMTCKWTVRAVVHEQGDPTRPLQEIWSDTVGVVLHGR